MKILRRDDLTGRPTVMFFGSYSCPVFRGMLPDMETFYRDYHNRMNIYLVYMAEAHPNDPVPFPTPNTFESRLAAANAVRSLYGLSMPMLVESMSNDLNGKLGGNTLTVLVVNASGTVAYNTNASILGGGFEKLRRAVAKLL